MVLCTRDHRRRRWRRVNPPNHIRDLTRFVHQEQHFPVPPQNLLPGEGSAVKVCTTDDAARRRTAVFAFPFIIISVLDCTQYARAQITDSHYYLYLSCTPIRVLNTCVGVYRLNIIFFFFKILYPISLIIISFLLVKPNINSVFQFCEHTIVSKIFMRIYQ